jgi:predicted 3-demethylubiquinone-9 3-methyltransferase (glyoxalase superfamily)
MNEITPRLGSTPTDPEMSRRVMAAMLKMKKIEIAAAQT